MERSLSGSDEAVPGTGGMGISRKDLTDTNLLRIGRYAIDTEVKTGGAGGARSGSG